MTDFDLHAYLRRIGYSGPLRPDLAVLRALQVAHLAAIPFEGIDPFVGRRVNIGLDAVQAKLVRSRRGGYCFELNGLFRGALDAIGFSTTGLAARVRWTARPEEPLSPRTHMLILVHLPDGPRLVDVGFGSCLVDEPLDLATGVEQRTAMGTFRLEHEAGLYWLHVRLPQGWRTMYAFDLQPQIQSDYELGNWYTASHPSVPFPSVLIVERLLPDRRLSLVNRRFTEEARGGAVVSCSVVADAATFGAILDQTFGITPPVPVEELFGRCCADGPSED